MAADEVIKYRPGEFGEEAIDGVTNEGRSRILVSPRENLLVQREPDRLGPGEI